MQIVILAGGLGTRLLPLTARTPKSLVRVNGKPFLEYQLRMFKRNAIRDVILCVGHLGDQIKRTFGDGGRLGLSIRYSEEGQGLLGTAGAIRHAEAFLGEEFFLTYGDSICPLDYEAVLDWFRRRDRLALMIVCRNRNELDRSNVVVSGEFVKVYDKEGRTPGMEYINYGVSLLRKEAVSLIPSDRPVTQEDFYALLIDQQQLLALETPQRFYEVGSPRGLREFRRLVGARGIEL